MDIDLAYDHYVAVQRNYLVSLIATKLMLGNDHAKDQIEAHLQVAAGFDPKTERSRLHKFGVELIDLAHKENETEFQGIRRAYLVNACGALENLAKCCFVSWVGEDPEVTERVQARRMSFTLSEFLYGDHQDRVFAAADRVFQEVDGHRPFNRFCSYLRPLVPAQFADRLSSLEEINAECFNEAFLIRNRLVHHGASADVRLSKKFGISKGEPLIISRDHVAGYMRTLDAMASVIKFVTPPILDI